MQYLVRQRYPNGQMSQYMTVDTERKTVQLVPGITRKTFLENYTKSLRTEFQHYSKLEKRNFLPNWKDFDGSITEDQYVEKNIHHYDDYVFLPAKGEK